MKKRFALFLTIWFVLDLIVALILDLHADEAYYRLYGEYLAWGYFDHPPMIGLMTFLSSKLFVSHGVLAKLSVRFCTLVLHVFTVIIVWKIFRLRHKERSEVFIRDSQNGFFLIAGSTVMFCATGFITTPDAPLMFFAAAFWYCYCRYLDAVTKRDLWVWAVMIGISIAGMLYSKYMGALVVAFVVLSNWRLIKDGRMWVALTIAFVLFIPHLYWQYSNGFPTFSYHLVERNTEFDWLYLVEYIPNQLLVFNPLMTCLMFVLAWRVLRSDDAFKRALGVDILGFELFFLLSAFRGHVEPHWTMVASVPAILLLMDDWTNRNTENTFFSKKWIRQTLVVMFVLVQITRIVLCLKILPSSTGLAGQLSYYEYVRELAGDRPVVFEGSFQDASMYRFYHNEESTLVRTQWQRYTQYDLLHLEENLIGKPVCIVRWYCQNVKDTVMGVEEYEIRYKLVDSFTLDDLK